MSLNYDYKIPDSLAKDYYDNLKVKLDDFYQNVKKYEYY